MIYEYYLIFVVNTITSGVRYAIHIKVTTIHERY